MWFDSHCHVTAPEFDSDRPEVLERASRAGVQGCVAIGSGYGIGHNAAAVALAGTDPRVWATVGVHPHEASQLDDAARRQLAEWLGKPRVVAVGECGLDYHYMHSSRNTQRAVLAEQLAWARERGLPVSLHVRGESPNAFEELLEIWESEARGSLRGVLHCYTGNLEFARRALDAGLWISFSGILTFARDRGVRDVARALPLDRLLVETDAPLLAPEGHRGRRNEPCHVALVGERLARLHGVTAEQAASATTGNARELFGLAA